ncbi:phage baseplate assembly protein [Sphingomonas canadensis]|uniref:Phage baseplate assembly protein n=1 Tax=Sphingomonas canadensis TaxID=1219257 RepID=A0ABW3H797_9SPHN|nr:hypothetical protein [Sphingomonas canadensis]MCW3835965.1 hypothetical protein [Sphingomonas canadensis]
MVDAAAIQAALAEKVELAVGGKLYSGWHSISVTRALDALAGGFELALASREQTGAARFEVRPDDACELRIAGETVITGWVDAVSSGGGASEAVLRVSGRDKTGDLADCSAIHKPGTWRKAKIEAIAAALAAPFGISVTAKASTGAPVDKFALQQGETIDSAIERLLRLRGLLKVAAPGGGMEIITPDEGAPIATLEHGVNILSFEGTIDHRERFSDYIVKGQAAGNDRKNGKVVTQIRGEARDAGVRRYRPKLIVAEEQGDGASLKTRAAWEAGVRAGRATSLTLSVPGWRAGGQLWRPNVRARVKCAEGLIADQVMLVTEVTLTRDEAGTIAQLRLAPPGAWKQLAGGGR